MTVKVAHIGPIILSLVVVGIELNLLFHGGKIFAQSCGMQRPDNVARSFLLSVQTTTFAAAFLPVDTWSDMQHCMELSLPVAC